jgi:uncharacterized protein (TIGR03437 family)
MRKISNHFPWLVKCNTTRRGQMTVTRLRQILILLGWAPLAMAQPQLQFAFPAYQAPNSTYSSIVQLPSGDTLFIGSNTIASVIGLSTTATQHSQIALTAVGPPLFQNGEPPDVNLGIGGSGNDVPRAAAVDPSGNIWIAGNTDSDDFNLVNPIVSQKVPYRTAGFVLELDPTGTKLLFATYLAGQQRSSVACSICYYASEITAMAIDGAGNVYVGGSTDEADFPTTQGAFMAKAGLVGPDAFGDAFIYSFVVKISPAGKLAYGTFLGTGASDCVGGSSCIGHASTSAGVSSMAVDGAGNLTVAGIAGGSYNLGSGYVSRLSADGSKLLWSARTGGNYAGVTTLVMAQDSMGNVDVLGRYVTAIVEPGLPPEPGTPGLFAAKLSSDGSRVIYSNELGLSVDANVIGIVLDASGNAYLAGTSSSAQFPVVAGVPDLGANFVLRLDPSGGTAQALFRFPLGTVSVPPALDGGGQLLLAGSTGSLLTLPPNYAFNTPAIVGFANAASFALNTGIAPGELVSLFGFDLGGSPQNVQVLIGGMPATVLYAGPNQINVQVPFETPAETPSIFGPRQVQVVVPSGSVSVSDVPLAQSLGIFTSDGVHAAALNQDGSVNSTSNPAARGSIVTLFGTGAAWPGGIQDGAIAGAAAPLDQEQNQFEMVDRTGTPEAILYAGAAPGLIYGVFQLNVQLTSDVALPLMLRASNDANVFLPAALTSNSVQIYLK